MDWSNKTLSSVSLLVLILIIFNTTFSIYTYFKLRNKAGPRGPAGSRGPRGPPGNSR